MSLNFAQKAEILAKLDKGMKGTQLASEYNVANSTISYIKNQKADILNFIANQRDHAEMSRRITKTRLNNMEETKSFCKNYDDDCDSLTYGENNGLDNLAKKKQKVEENDFSCLDSLKSELDEKNSHSIIGKECDIETESEKLSQSFDYDDEELESCDGSKLDKDDEMLKKNLLTTQNSRENELNRSFDYDDVTESYDSSQSGEDVETNEQHSAIVQSDRASETNSTDDSGISANNDIAHILHDGDDDYDDDNQNDPNKLCERLRSLLMSNFAGNSNSDQEIRTIVSKLLDSGFIY